MASSATKTPEKERKKTRRNPSTLVSNDDLVRRSHRLALRKETNTNERSNTQDKKRVVLENRRILHSTQLTATPRCHVLNTVIALNVADIPSDVINIDEMPMLNGILFDRHYGREILSYVKQLEIIRSLPRTYLMTTDEKDIVNSKIRAVIVDWLIQVQHYLELSNETLHLSIKIIDHFFSIKCDLSPDKLQLAATASLLISSKIVERIPPKIATLVHLTADSYTKSDMLKMEQLILNCLNFTLVLPEPTVFLDRCYQISGAKNTLLRHLSHFLVELMVTNVKSVQTLPSLMASASFCLALKILCKGQEAKWSKQYKFYCGYNEESLSTMMQCMIDQLIHRQTSPYQGAVQKYINTELYGGVSSLSQLRATFLNGLLGVK
ncbi:G2/mitotic-specific cyclin-B2 [Chamberlinius hualienensis]